MPAMCVCSLDFLQALKTIEITKATEVDKYYQYFEMLHEYSLSCHPQLVKGDQWL